MLPLRPLTELQKAEERRRAGFIRRVAVSSAVVLVIAAAVVLPLVLHGQSSAAGTGEPATSATAAYAGDGPSASGSGPVSTSPPAVMASSTTVAASTTTTLFAPGTSTFDVARIVKANELGLVPVLMYHKIGPDIVAPQRLREDIGLLRQGGFYPTTIREMVEGTMDIPAGKSPVILTFDDSSPTHYKILDDGTLDPDCAVAIILAAVKFGEWAPKASFFPLLQVDSAANIVFGQPEYAEVKLRNLVDWGFEVGSHSMTHRDLSRATAAQIGWELAESEAELEEMIGGGYKLFTLNPPYGEYPDDVSLLVSGEYKGMPYQFSAVLMAAGGKGFSPFSTEFDPLHIRRITAYPTDTVRDLIFYFQKHPELRFVSDGDPDMLSVPQIVPAELGMLRNDLGKTIYRYWGGSL